MLKASIHAGFQRVPRATLVFLMVLRLVLRMPTETVEVAGNVPVALERAIVLDVAPPPDVGLKGVGSLSGFEPDPVGDVGP